MLAMDCRDESGVAPPAVAEGDGSVSPTLESPPPRTTSRFGHCVACGTNLGSDRSPQLLPCLHSMCQLCVPRDVAIGASECPVCGVAYSLQEVTDNLLSKESPSRSGAQTVTQCGGCEQMVVSGWCVECGEALCSECISAHKRVRVTRDHTVLPQKIPAGSARTVFCPSHKEEPMKLFCLSCDELTCRDCQLSFHRNHRFQFVRDAVAGQREELRALMERLRQDREKVRQCLSVLDGRLQDLTELQSKVKNELKDTIVSIRAALLKRAIKLAMDMQELCGSEKGSVIERKTVLKRLEERQDYLLAFTERALDSEDHSALLSCKRKIQLQLQDALSRVISPGTSMMKLKFHCDPDALNQITNSFGKIVAKRVPFACSDGQKVPRKASNPPLEIQNPNNHSKATAQIPPASVRNHKVSSQNLPAPLLYKIPSVLHHPPTLSHNPPTSFYSPPTSSHNPPTYSHSPPSSNHLIPNSTQISPASSGNRTSIAQITPASSSNPSIGFEPPVVASHSTTTPSHSKLRKSMPHIMSLLCPASSSDSVPHSSSLKYPLPHSSKPHGATSYSPYQPKRSSLAARPGLPHPPGPPLGPKIAPRPPFSSLVPTPFSSPATVCSVSMFPVILVPDHPNTNTNGLNTNIPAVDTAPVGPSSQSLLTAGQNCTLSAAPAAQWSNSSADMNTLADHPQSTEGQHCRKPCHTPPVKAPADSPCEKVPPADSRRLGSPECAALENEPTSTATETDAPVAKVAVKTEADLDGGIVAPVNSSDTQVSRCTATATPDSGPAKENGSSVLAVPVSSSLAPLSILEGTVNTLPNSVGTQTLAPSGKQPTGHEVSQVAGSAISPSVPIIPVPATVKLPFPIHPTSPLFHVKQRYLEGYTQHLPTQHPTLTEQHIPHPVQNGLDEVPLPSTLDPHKIGQVDTPKGGQTSREESHKPSTEQSALFQDAQGVSDTSPTQKDLSIPDAAPQANAKLPDSSADLVLLNPQSPAHAALEYLNDLFSCPVEENDSDNTDYSDAESIHEPSEPVTRHLNPYVSLVRLPITIPPSGQPLPHFRILPITNAQEIFLELIEEGNQTTIHLKLPGRSQKIKRVLRRSQRSKANLIVLKDHKHPIASPTHIRGTNERASLPSSEQLVASSEDAKSAIQANSLPRRQSRPLLAKKVSCAVCHITGRLTVCAVCGRGYHRDCHIPAIITANRGQWQCMLCWDPSGTKDQQSLKPKGPPSLSLSDQRKCEHLLLILISKKYSSVLYQQVQCIDIRVIRGRLLGKLSPPYKTPSEFVSDVLFLLNVLCNSSKDSSSVAKLQKCFQKTLSKVFGTDVHPSAPELSPSPVKAGVTDAYGTVVRQRGTVKRLGEFMKTQEPPAKKPCKDMDEGKK